MKIFKKAVLPVGFQASGVAAGIKKSGKLDLALFYSDMPAKVVALFTTNSIQSAHIKIDKRYLKGNKEFRAIITNSGNANSFTGSQGTRDAEKTLHYTAKALGVQKESILVASTGVIGRRLPLVKIKKAIPFLVRGLCRQGINKAKRSIMTTDTFPKEVTVRFNIGNRNISICGVAKGAGMIAPNLATMLCFIFTDANITHRGLAKALDSAVENSFNCITVDGCMSTNDTVFIFANSAAGNSLIDSGRNFNLFVQALNIVCLKLAKMIVRDAEGATKFIQIKINQASSFNEAKKVALAIANSCLFKTAMFGSSHNIAGRIVASIGASGVGVKESDIEIKFSPLNKKEVNIDVSLKRGKSSAVIYTSDLTYEYIKINAEYN